MTSAMLYGRKRPPLDTARAAPGAFDSVFYFDRECTRPACWFPWYSSDRPDYRRRRLMYNCAAYQIEWLPPFTLADYPRLMAKTARSEYWEIGPGIFNTTPDPKQGGYYHLRSLMQLKGDYVFADYGRESAR